MSYFSGYFEISVSNSTEKQSESRWKQWVSCKSFKKCFLLNIKMIQACTQFKLGYLGSNSYSKAWGSGKMGMIPLRPTLAFPPPSKERTPGTKQSPSGSMSGGVWN